MSEIVILIADERLREHVAGALEAAGVAVRRGESTEHPGAVNIIETDGGLRVSTDSNTAIDLPRDVPAAALVGVINALQRAAAAEAAVRSSKEHVRRVAWAVGHDLAEPLRAVVTYNQLLERRYKDQLDDEGKRFIEHSVGAAQRMRAFLTDLLTFSQVMSDAAPSFAPVSMEAIFWAVNMTLHDAIAQSGATVTHDPLPTVQGNETRLTQLLQALVSNAVKFVRADAKPEVHVSATETESEWLFSVVDNGPGIDPQYYERAFEPFRRLHGREVPGSGLGLAVARAIAEAHGGRIWPEAAAGGGTKFCFTLPRER